MNYGLGLEQVITPIERGCPGYLIIRKELFYNDLLYYFFRGSIYPQDINTGT